MKLSTKRRALIVNLLLGGLLLGGVAAAYASLGSGSPAGAAPLTTPVTRGSVTASVSASGAVESARTRSLTFGTGGTVESIKVEPGDRVKKGAVLARLDDTAARESLEAAKASLDAAEDADTSTASGYSQYINVRNTYRAAKRALDATVIKAPYAGTVTAVNGTVGGSSGGSGGSGSSNGSAGSAGSGGTVAAQSTGSGFIEIADTTRLRIVGQFTEADVIRLKVGQAATVTFDALTGVSATGEVTVIDPQPQTTNNVVQYAATITLSQVPPTVRLGQTASVQVTVETVEDVLTLPTALITTAGGQSSVTVLDNDRQVRTGVEVGVKGDTTTEIVSGLKEGDQVVRPTTTSTTGGGFPIPGGLGGGGFIRQGGGGFGGGGGQGGGGGGFGGGGGQSGQGGQGGQGGGQGGGSR